MKSIRKQCDDLWCRKVKERASGKCEYCGNTKYIQCHHIIPRTNYAVRHDIENGVALCRKHHLYWAHKDTIAFYNWAKTIRDFKYLEIARHRQSKNDYQVIKLYLEGL